VLINKELKIIQTIIGFFAALEALEAPGGLAVLKTDE